MGKYIQGAAFYLFAYFILGLVNSGIMFVLTKLLNVMPAITLALLMFLTVFVLYFAFKKSLELFVFGENVKEIGELWIIVAWTVHFISFVAIATTVELYVLPLLGNPKLIKIGTVFANLFIFFLLYFLVVKAIVEKGGKVEA
jgi:hypothetical protein